MNSVENQTAYNKAKTSVYAKLFSVQQKLRVPKDRRNSFGGYTFRNAADILEKVKPYLDEVKAIVVISDDIREFGTEGRYYVSATALFIDTESGEFVETEGLAREEESKKGMDAAQLTGACSSYARKYALCGLFAIDDSRLDPDESQETSENRPSCPPSASPRTATPPTDKTPQKSSTMASALKEKAKEAWNMFKDLDSVKSMDENSRSKFFFSTLKAKTGKSDPAKLTVEDRDKVIGELDVMRAI